MSPIFLGHFWDIRPKRPKRSGSIPGRWPRAGAPSTATYTLRAVSIPAETLWIFALALLLFGSVFVFLGLSSERNYWTQRDPSGNAKQDATKFAKVYANAFKYAAGEYRAPLRIAAIGVIQWYLAIACAIAALLLGA